MAIADRLYARLPVVGQNAAVSLYGLWWKRLRFGGHFEQHLRTFQERETWDRERWREWQAAALARVLTAASENVPYYREHWSEDQHAAARDGQLEALPLLGKHPLRRDPKAFLDPLRAPRKPLVFHTSGSTGTPIASLWSRDELRASMAVREIRSAGWAGVSFNQPRATFSGRLAVPDPNSRGPFHRWNAAERQVYFSPFHLSPESAAQYVDALHHHRIVWLTGYATSYAMLARFMLAQGLEAPDTLRAVITTSEKLTHSMRSLMEKAFRCSVYEEYSTVESVLFASECERGSLHVSPDVGVVEILDPAGAPCPPGTVGEIVATQILRRTQPLIRFRLGDNGSWAEDPCPCGRVLPVISEVVGRIADVVRGPGGRELVRFPVFTQFPTIREGQIVQHALDRVTVRLVTDDEPSDDIASEVRLRVEQRLGAGVTVDVEWVPAIERTSAGKFRAVISHLSRDVPDDAHSEQQDRPQDSRP